MPDTMPVKPNTRREFARTLAATSTTAALSPFCVLGANDRVRLGFIGAGKLNLASRLT
jgi:hypothetical protein